MDGENLHDVVFVSMHFLSATHEQETMQQTNTSCRTKMDGVRVGVSHIQGGVAA